MLIQKLVGVDVACAAFHEDFAVGIGPFEMTFLGANPVNTLVEPRETEISARSIAVVRQIFVNLIILNRLIPVLFEKAVLILELINLLHGRQLHHLKLDNGSLHLQNGLAIFHGEVDEVAHVFSIL